MSMNVISDPSPEYARRLFSLIIDWYKTADLKAQIILGANGTFLTVLAGLILVSGKELRGILDSFGVETWAFLSVMALSLFGSFVSAVACLYSRTMRDAEVEEIFKKHRVDVADAETYDPAVMWFFQLIARLEEEPFESALKLVVSKPELEVEALADECILLSRNVVRKHHWINVGFVLSAVTLSSLLIVIASYTLRVAV
jgi:hypothetical protein